MGCDDALLTQTATAAAKTAVGMRRDLELERRRLVPRLRADGDDAAVAQAELAAIETELAAISNGTVDADRLATSSFEPVWNELFPRQCSSCQRQRLNWLLDWIARSALPPETHAFQFSDSTGLPGAYCPAGVQVPSGQTVHGLRFSKRAGSTIRSFRSTGHEICKSLDSNTTNSPLPDPPRCQRPEYGHWT